MFNLTFNQASPGGCKNGTSGQLPCFCKTLLGGEVFFVESELSWLVTVVKRFGKIMLEQMSKLRGEQPQIFSTAQRL